MSLMSDLEAAFGGEWSHATIHHRAGSLSITVDMREPIGHAGVMAVSDDGYAQSVTVPTREVVSTIRGMMGARAAYELHRDAFEAGRWAMSERVALERGQDAR